MTRVVAAALASGLALQLAAPPFELWPLAFVALAPVLYALHGRPARQWALAGIVVGLVNAACLVDGVIKWGPGAVVGLVAVVAAMVVVPFTAAGWLAPRLPGAVRPYALLAMWIGSAWILDEVLYTPLALAAPVALGAPWALGLVELLGALGLEAVVVGFACAVAAAVRQPRHALVLPVFALLPLASWVPPLETAGQGRVVGVQPNVHWSDYAATGWSLERRSAIEASLDALTAEAIALGGTVVWPENGNTLANAQVARRVEALKSMLARGGDVLVSGRELEDGHEYLSVFRFTADGVAERARKANLVPFAEADLEPGAPAVMATAAGPLGVSVCYDAMFSRHGRALVAAGAEALVVTTDDTSFGRSSIARRHLGYAVLRAAELGRALVFVANEGPGVSYDPRTRTVEAHALAGRRAVYAVDVPRVVARTAADRGARHLVPLALLLLVAGALAQSVVAGRRTPAADGSARRPQVSLGTALRRTTLASATVLACLVVGVVSDVAQRAAADGLAPITADLVRRMRGTRGVDGLGPLYQQREPLTCGPTALAFALTRLGDLVFEEAFAGSAAAGTSLGELARAAEQRGFAAHAWHADRLDALRFGPGVVHVLHVAPHHYVVAFDRVGDQVHVLDPALGAVLRVPLTSLEARWTGYALELSHRPALASAPARVAAHR